MNKLKSIINKLLTWFKTSPIVKAVIVWIVGLVVLAFVVDKIALPIFSGHFAKTGIVPNLEGLEASAVEKALDSAGFKYEWLERAATAHRCLRAWCSCRCLPRAVPQSSAAR